MAQYFTRALQGELEITRRSAKIERAEIGEEKYRETYGKDSLLFNGYLKNALIMQLGIINGQKALIHFNRKKTVSNILKDMEVRKARNLNEKKLTALLQSDKVIGIDLK